MNIHLDSVQRRRLADLSIVNELDVWEQPMEAKATCGPALSRRSQSWRTLGSKGVLQDAEATFGDHPTFTLVAYWGPFVQEWGTASYVAASAGPFIGLGSGDLLVSALRFSSC